ncbi:MAG TPA: sugar ABC transporter permease [Candidatus Limiplasma sp.]|nr:sugar ABC transporter permease [Candidatus Limiplasma sp.]HRX08061.1 sugar ABC transporter permease [Candidatus Limiplasma sp.]
MQSQQTTPNHGKKHAIVRVGQALISFFAQFFRDLRDGDLWVRLSLVVFGAGYFRRGQIVKGILVTALQAFVFIFYPIALWPYVSKFGTLGTVKRAAVFNPVTLKNEVNDFDHSFMILLFGLVGILVIAAVVLFWIKNIHAVRGLQITDENNRKILQEMEKLEQLARQNGADAQELHRKMQVLKANTKRINRFSDDICNLFNRKFHITLLTLPSLGVMLFTILPLLVMICVAFTNYDQTHMVPTNLFTWVGLNNFKTLFTQSQTITFGYSFGRVLSWTLIWAFFATFTNFIFGILLAMFINNRKTHWKRMWRTLFIITIAVPQFVSLLLVRNFFANTGIVNTIFASVGITDFLKQIGLLSQSYAYIPFLTDPVWAKVMIILINMWIGIPYMMLIATGILMNIPSDILESARIDGANAFQSFRKITMPYILFVTAPYLVTSITANINNFNVIYLLTNDVFVTKDQLLANSNAQEVDLLVTWLYRLTQNYYNYKMASVIGIVIFIISAVFTVLAFRILIRGDREERFQ